MIRSKRSCASELSGIGVPFPEPPPPPVDMLFTAAMRSCTSRGSATTNRAFPGECQACGAARVLDRVEAGERFYKPAMVQVRNEDGGLVNIECTACGGSWTGDEMKELVK